MEFKIEDLSQEDFSRLQDVMLNYMGSFEPWADMMNLSGAGDPGIDHFPLDLDDIETIEITRVGGEGSH